MVTDIVNQFIHEKQKIIVLLEKLHDVKSRETVENFLLVLKRISKAIKRDFSGIGLILYSKGFDFTNCIPLKPEIKLNQAISINEPLFTEKMLINFSRKSHPLHDGFHLFNEDGILTHVSQYIIPPKVNGILPHKKHGTRFLTAMLSSFLEGVIVTGIVESNNEAFVFHRGKVYRIE